MIGMWDQIFKDWLFDTGYSTVNDWGFQTIEGWNYYWIINPETDKFAFIRDKSLPMGKKYYEVLVKDWVDYNGWAEKFHLETGGVYKNDH